MCKITHGLPSVTWSNLKPQQEAGACLGWHPSCTKSDIPGSSLIHSMRESAWNEWKLPCKISWYHGIMEYMKPNSQGWKGIASLFYFNSLWQQGSGFHQRCPWNERQYATIFAKGNQKMHLWAEVLHHLHPSSFHSSPWLYPGRFQVNM